MIFVTLGSQKFQFNRLLKELDKLVNEGEITEGIFAQIGYSDYKPQNYKYKEFLDREEFCKVMQKADKVITHGGTGAIIGAIKNDKKVIAIPRLQKYGEHVDDHQLQIVEEFNKMKFIKSVIDIEELIEQIDSIEEFENKKYISNTKNVINSIEEFIER